MNQARVQALGVSKSFEHEGSLPVLRNVHLHAGDGEFVSIVGPSGCGKSTLCNIISGVVPPDLGRVTVDGEDAAGRVGLVGYMPQKDLLLPWRNVLDNVVLGLEVMGVPKRDARAEAAPLFAEFGLAGFESAFPFTLSGGMRQRAAFMRTAMFKKSTLVLDEPFGALDALTRSSMQEWLLDVWAKLGQTIILVTHDVEEAVLLSDRVYVMSSRPGEIKAELTIDLPRPRTYELVGDPAFVELKLDILRRLRAATPNLAATQ